MDLIFLMVFLKRYVMDPAKRQIFRDASGQIFSLILRPCHRQVLSPLSFKNPRLLIGPELWMLQSFYVISTYQLTMSYMTRSQYKGKYLSGRVTKILTLCRIHEIFFQKYHEKAEIYLFYTLSVPTLQVSDISVFIYETEADKDARLLCTLTFNSSERIMCTRLENRVT